MKIYLLNSIGKADPHIFPYMVEGFKSCGHEIVGRIEDCDVVFWDLYSGKGFFGLDTISKAIKKRCIYYDMTDYGGMSNEVFPTDLLYQNKKGFEHWWPVKDADIRFVRKMDKTITYFKNVYPIEVCEFDETKDISLATPDELFSRPYDFVWCGNESPQRRVTIENLQKHFNGYVHWTNERGKIPYDEWLGLHRQGKFFIESDGGGFGSERPQQLIRISPMLKQKNNHLQSFPFTNSVNCVTISENPTQQEIDYLKLVLSNKDELYKIYLNGTKHMANHYSKEARVSYILDVLKQNGIQ